MLRVMRKLLPIGVLLVCAMCSAQTEKEVGVDIEIRGADVLPTDIRNTMLAELQKHLVNKALSQDLIFELAESLRDQFQQHGYFKAQVADPPNWQDSLIVHNKQTPQIVFETKPGDVYRAGEIRFRGNDHFSGEQLRTLLPVRQGQVLNVEDVRQGLKKLRDFYGERGYMNFTPVPNTEFHDEDKTIDIVFDLEEGDQFFFGPMTLDGEEVTAGAGRRLLNAWQPFVGRVYNQTITEMMTLIEFGGTRNLENSELERALRECGPYSLEVSTNREDHVVTIHINLLGPK